MASVGTNSALELGFRSFHGRNRNRERTLLMSELTGFYPRLRTLRKCVLEGYSRRAECRPPAGLEDEGCVGGVAITFHVEHPCPVVSDPDDDARTKCGCPFGPGDRRARRPRSGGLRSDAVGEVGTAAPRGPVTLRDVNVAPWRGWPNADSEGGSHCKGAVKPVRRALNSWRPRTGPTKRSATGVP